jgi:hypothetical protein
MKGVVVLSTVRDRLYSHHFFVSYDCYSKQTLDDGNRNTPSLAVPSLRGCRILPY